MAKIGAEVDTVNVTEEIKKATGPIQKDMEKMTLIMGGVIIVLFVGFITMLVAFYSVIINDDGSKQASYQQLVTEIQRLNDR